MTRLIGPSFFLTYLMLTSVAGALQGDPDGTRNQASRAALPAGKGLAEAFPADAGIADHSAVIFAEDFEGQKPLGNWDEVRNDRESVLAIVAPPGEPSREPLGDRVLRVTARLDQNTGGGMTKWFPSADRVFIRFYTLFAADCDYVHHFCTLRANRGLQGGDRWSGFGGAGQLPEGTERFSTALEPWGDWGRWPAPGRWNMYSYWHEMAASPDGKYWGNAFRPAEQPLIQRGQWICAEFMVRHNTPGKPDGEQAFWIDGKLLGHWTGINWRKSPSLQANAFTLESYVTDRWTKNRLNTVYFDNVVIAREYIGPSGTPQQASQ